MTLVFPIERRGLLFLLELARAIAWEERPEAKIVVDSVLALRVIKCYPWAGEAFEALV
jgi:hypothetical protein